MQDSSSDVTMSDKQAQKAFQVVSNSLLGSKGKEMQRFIKRENEIREIFNLSTDAITSFTTFEQAEQFITEVVAYPDTQPVTSVYRKIRQLYVLKDRKAQS